MTKEPRAKSRYKPRSPEQKARRQELWIAQETMRRDAGIRRCLARYEELKIEMARHGSNIGPIDDLQGIDDPQRYADVLRARVERWDALWSITKRKKDTRGKIIIGGAILAELADLDFTLSDDQALLSRMVDLLDKRVERVRDRTILRYLLTASAQAEIQLSLLRRQRSKGERRQEKWRCQDCQSRRGSIWRPDHFPRPEPCGECYG